MSASEDQIRDLLARDAEQVQVRGDLVGAAMKRYRRDHRRRVATGAVAGLAAVAVMVPVAWGLFGRQSSLPLPAPSGPMSSITVPTTPSTSRPSTSTTSSTAPTTSTTTSSPVAGGPSAYAEGTTLRLGSATVQVGGADRIVRFASLAGGGSFVESVDGPATVTRLLDGTGRAVRTVLPNGGSWSASTDGDLVATVDDRNRATVYDATGGVVATRQSDAVAAAVVDRTVYLAGDASTLAWDVDSGATRTLPGRITDVSGDGGRALRVWSPDGDGEVRRCWALLDITGATAREVHQECAEAVGAAVPISISPDGRRLLAQQVVEQVTGTPFAVLDAETGEVQLGTADRPGPTGWSAAWTRRGRILVSRNTSGASGLATRNTLQECAVDGLCTDVAAERPVDEATAQPLYVVAQPGQP
ncbi:hypothetical protein DFJ68_0032 [Terracoccus luteus]|uniref:WD40 repeat protein n=1 Tax=Terracoccus luteus TaxID=53356 RepID=A0A495XUY7_9MICO|nr:hypothetical protein [Terracoccus luteus]RKT76636.1 hypothetical protein DFJ68_0032 [Terracoccus luteus]